MSLWFRACPFVDEQCWFLQRLLVPDAQIPRFCPRLGSIPSWLCAKNGSLRPWPTTCVRAWAMSNLATCCSHASWTLHAKHSLIPCEASVLGEPRSWPDTLQVHRQGSDMRYCWCEPDPWRQGRTHSCNRQRPTVSVVVAAAAEVACQARGPRWTMHDGTQTERQSPTGSPLTH